MADVAFDTLKMAQGLKDSGMEDKQAEAVVILMHDAINERVATRTDLTTTESALRGDMGALRSDMEKMETALRSDMEKMETALRGDMEKMETALRGDMEKMEISLRGDMEKMELRMTVKFFLIQASFSALLFAALRLFLLPA